MQNEATSLLSEGIYYYSHTKSFAFDETQLVVNSMNIVTTVISVDFEEQVIKPMVISKFDVEKRGRHVQTIFNTPSGQIPVNYTRLVNMNQIVTEINLNEIKILNFKITEIKN